MNTQHLQYIIEIERTRSISQAAENLFLGQPNLSRILHDLEDALGVRIFERTSRGVRPTERGAKFLQHARNVLREMEYIDALGPRHAVPNRLRVCIPRSAKTLALVSSYIAGLDARGGLDAQIRECHARRALEMLSSGDAEIGIIRFRSEYCDYFEEQTAQRELSFQVLSRYKYRVLLPLDHPLAQKKTLRMEDLDGYTEIVHGDNFRVRTKQEEAERRKILTVDRLAQVSLLETIWGAYMWSQEQPQRCLERWHLVQKTCENNPVTYHDALIYNPQYVVTDIEVGFIRHVLSQMQR